MLVQEGVGVTVDEIDKSAIEFACGGNPVVIRMDGYAHHGFYWERDGNVVAYHSTGLETLTERVDPLIEEGACSCLALRAGGALRPGGAFRAGRSLGTCGSRNSGIALHP